MEDRKLESMNKRPARVNFFKKKLFLSYFHFNQFFEFSIMNSGNHFTAPPIFTRPSNIKYSSSSRKAGPFPYYSNK